MVFDDLKTRCDAVEECYEFMLAYAAQGVPTHTASDSGAQLQHLLNKAAEAISGLPGAFETAIRESGLGPESIYRSWGEILAADARASFAAISMVLIQPHISSQLIDNLNASIHLRALLTDLFLIDEILKGYEVVMPV
jgi:hypothetical protein